MNNLIFSLGVIGNALSFLIFLAPINTFLRIVKNQSTEEFNPAPYVVTLLNCSLWVYYGVTKPGAYLIATVNAAGILLEAIYVVLFLIYASPNLRSKTAVLVGVLDAVFFVGVVFVTKFGVEKTLQVLVIGVICSCFNTLMYASPLSAMKIVVTTKSVEYMPFLLSFFLFLNGGVWTFYAILANDIFAAKPNGIGCFLGAIQLVLYMMYLDTKVAKKLEDANDGWQRQRLIEHVEHDEEEGHLN